MMKYSMKIYYENNKDTIKESTKEYYENNKDKIQEHKKYYYEINKNKIKGGIDVEVICACGKNYIGLNNKKRHETSKKHLSWLHDEMQTPETI